MMKAMTKNKIIVRWNLNKVQCDCFYLYILTCLAMTFCWCSCWHSFFKPIRLIACMFGNKSSHLGWFMSSYSNLVFKTMAWFFIPLHVKPVGLVFMCILYDMDMHHVALVVKPMGSCSNSNVGTAFEAIKCLSCLKTKKCWVQLQIIWKRFEQYQKYFDSCGNQTKYLKNTSLMLFLTWHGTMPI